MFAQKASAIDIGLDYGDNIGLGTNDPVVMVLNFIRVALGLLGLIVVIMILYSGFLYMTSGGNEAQVEKAKKTLKNAVIGLVIILASFGIVSFVIQKMREITTPPGAGGSPTQDPRNIRALGNGIIKNVYPEPGQTNVPMNTVVIVTFREKIKPETICQSVSGGLCAPNSPLITDNVRIFQQVHEPDCLGTGSCGFAEGAKVMSTDNETFVFYPDKRLGNLSTVSMGYSVFLTKDIKKADGKDAFRALENGYVWNFFVSNTLDLEPPQVVQYKMFPSPDNEKDETGIVSGAIQASGSLKVLSMPKQHLPAQLVSITPFSSPPAGVVVDEHSSEDGMLILTIDVDGVTAKLARQSDNISLGSTRVSDNSVNFPGIFKLTLINPGDVFTAGNSWEVSVKKEVPADTLTIDNITYSFSTTGGAFKIVADPDNAVTAQHIKEAINGEDTFNSPHPKVSAANSSDTVALTAKVASALGNNIALSTSNTAAITVTPMSGGKDREVKTTVLGGSSDKPRNSVIQINFNEPINPITISGPSAEVAKYLRIVNADGGLGEGEVCSLPTACRSLMCESGQCKGSYLAGKFLMSNQYHTAEFLSDNECGTNACGEKIYCLPEKSHIKVELSAATLDDCGADNCERRSPYNNCSANICTDPNNKNYPLARMPMDGIVDMAVNSLDGNRSTYADGPQTQSGQPAFDDNNPDPVKGDDYQWSFFINDIIDISSPFIETVSQNSLEVNIDAQGVRLVDPINILFNKLMMSFSLASGEVVFKDPFTGALTAHRLINIWAHNDSYAVGYWVTKKDLDNPPQDNFPDKTAAVLNHSRFARDVTYRTQYGSGIKDIYQNCYNPSSRTGAGSGNICDGAPSCCDGNPVVGSTCP